MCGLGEGGGRWVMMVSGGGGGAWRGGGVGLGRDEGRKAMIIQIRASSLKGEGRFPSKPKKRRENRSTVGSVQLVCASHIYVYRL